MNTIILSLHPFFQGLGMLLAFYAALLGVQRTRSLHFGRSGVSFHRKRHALIGAIALFMLLGGFAGGLIITGLVIKGPVDLHLHETGAKTILPFLLIGIGTGLYLYYKPARRKVLPAVHALNNVIILVLLLVQAYSGVHVYLNHILKIH